MGLPAINSLANMEFMLYGGASGLNPACPSYANGYRSGVLNSIPNPYMQYMNPAFGYNPTFNGGYTNTGYPSIYSQAQGDSYQSTQNTAFQGLTQEDMNKLADYYAKNNVLEEGFAGAAAGGLSWLAFEHAQSLFHPLNAYKGAKTAEAVFKNIPKEFAKENAVLLQDAYIAAQQATRDTQKKWVTSGWLRRQIGKKHPGDEKEIEKLVKNLHDAIKSKNVNGIAEYTAKLQAARGFDGKLIPGKARSVAERLADATNKGKLNKEIDNLLKMNGAAAQNKFGGLIKGAFKKDFLMFMAFEALFGLGKIFTAFNKDSETGLKQTGQTVGKAATATAGWCLGRAAGTWLGAKAGAAIGSAICPGAGTAIGALIGFTVGSIGMWAGHKLGGKVFGADVADKIDAKNLTKTEEGQVQLLQFAMQKAQEGKTDPATNQILNKLNVYA